MPGTRNSCTPETMNAILNYALIAFLFFANSDRYVRASITKRSDGLARDLVRILVEEKQERQKLREENRMIKKKLDDVLRELRDRNKLLGDNKFLRKKLIDEVKSTKAELKSELLTELNRNFATINNTVSDLKSDTDDNKEKGDKMGELIDELQKDGSQLKKRLTNVKGKVKVLEDTNRGHGAVYTRWGRQSCPTNKTDLVYTGRLGGTEYSRGKGGPSNYLCLPDDPDWRVYKSGMQPNSPIVGGEYQVDYYSEGELLDKKYHDYEIVCSVCQTQERKAVIMIPGKSRCYDGWHMEYRGYLMSGRIGHSPSQYICVDAKPDVIPGTNGNKNGAIIYTVEAGCISMKCPPYVKGRELTCVVCTK